ncbi:hypothetical protein CPC08DRAFT_675696, partial [Agrocybe pediades]
MESTVPTTSGIFERAHDLDVHNGTFMSAAGNIYIYHNAPPPNSDSPANSGSPDQFTRSSSAARSSVIYHRNLITKRRGSPLWIPEPDDTLPTSYQRKGVSFGDVGLLSPSGSFVFFFNICYPSDDPINSGGVPEGFKPFKSSFLKITGSREFEAASYVASESIKISRKQCIDSQAADLVFESSAAEGAILTMPNGARSEDLVGTLHLREYVLENIESWYKLIMCDFGCDVENGDILVVTGCDKTDSWGIATFVKSSEAVKLTFQAVPSSRSYKWEYFGSFDARTGPNLKVIQGLQSSTSGTDVASSEPLLNQCVFVRTLTATLSDDIWESLRRSVSRLDPNKDMHNGQNFLKGDVGPGTFSLPTSSESSTDNGNSMRGGWSGQQRQDLPVLQPLISLASNVSTTMMNHPSKLLNHFLWTNSGHKYPSARVVITEDKDWISVLRDDDSTLPDISELYRRITEPEVEVGHNTSAGFITRSFAPPPINLSHSIVAGGTFTQHDHIDRRQYIRSGERPGYARLLENVATDALYDSAHVIDPPKCYPNTRVAIIQTIIDWTLEKAYGELREKPILWLKGGAGAGKSAIARSVAERCSDDGLLLGTFFFGATDPTRNHVEKLVATLSYQIGVVLPEFRDKVAFIEDDLLIFNRSIRTQFFTLIIHPLSAVLANRPTASSAMPCLIIIDGLDECSSIESQHDLLFTLQETINTTSLIRFLLCSRPTSHLDSAFSLPSMVPILRKISLDGDYVAREDIRVYLEDKFKQIKEGDVFKHTLPDSWPKPGMIDTLVDKSSGQFIYAATVIRY